jgi:hypothetical protein
MYSFLKVLSLTGGFRVRHGVVPPGDVTRHHRAGVIPPRGNGLKRTRVSPPAVHADGVMDESCGPALDYAP